MVKYKKDYFAGGLMILIGAGATLQGLTYKLGTLTHMGSGFFPVSLGILLTFLGIMIAGTAIGSTPSGDQHILPERPEWLGWLCIIGGPICFIVFGELGGMIPGTFMCVFVCALGDRTATLKGSFILAAGITLFGVLLFSYLLQIPFPLLRWRFA